MKGCRALTSEEVKLIKGESTVIFFLPKGQKAIARHTPYRKGFHNGKERTEKTY